MHEQDLSTFLKEVNPEAAKEAPSDGQIKEAWEKAMTAYKKAQKENSDLYFARDAFAAELKTALSGFGEVDQLEDGMLYALGPFDLPRKYWIIAGPGGFVNSRNQVFTKLFGSIDKKRKSFKLEVPAKINEGAFKRTQEVVPTGTEDLHDESPFMDLGRDEFEQGKIS